MAHCTTASFLRPRCSTVTTTCALPGASTGSLQHQRGISLPICVTPPKSVSSPNTYPGASLNLTKTIYSIKKYKDIELVLLRFHLQCMSASSQVSSSSRQPRPSAQTHSVQTPDLGLPRDPERQAFELVRGLAYT
ncbi:hypothetical protein E2C01_005060 [Portunus trituberculatus]|uniref:Uncharacterized protein n=1 Tax=Portunus trituberculatus TaxID=210409 RepID=A0A5B7CU05_PORTR|nr:hypothetical protein [Portunus trituberculatus]